MLYRDAECLPESRTHGFSYLVYSDSSRDFLLLLEHWSYTCKTDPHIYVGAGMCLWSSCLHSKWLTHRAVDSAPALTSWSHEAASSPPESPPPRLVMLRVRTVTVRCRRETAVCWEVSHPEPDCDTGRKKQLGTRAICCSSYRFDFRGSLSLGATPSRLDSKAAACIQKVSSIVSQPNPSRSSQAETLRAATSFLCL